MDKIETSCSVTLHKLTSFVIVVRIYYSLSHIRLALLFTNNGQNWLCSEFKCEYIEQKD